MTRHRRVNAQSWARMVGGCISERRSGMFVHPGLSEFWKRGKRDEAVQLTAEISKVPKSVFRLLIRPVNQHQLQMIEWNPIREPDGSHW